MWQRWGKFKRKEAPSEVFFERVGGKELAKKKKGTKPKQTERSLGDLSV